MAKAYSEASTRSALATPRLEAMEGAVFFDRPDRGLAFAVAAASAVDAGAFAAFGRGAEDVVAATFVPTTVDLLAAAFLERAVPDAGEASVDDTACSIAATMNALSLRGPALNAARR